MDWLEEEIMEDLKIQITNLEQKLESSKALNRKFMRLVSALYSGLPSYGDLKDGLDLRALADECRHEATQQAMADMDKDGFGLD